MGSLSDMTAVISVLDDDRRTTVRRERADRERLEMRARILECSCEILRSGSMFDLTIQRVARELNVSRPTVYRYFPTVQDIFKALSDETIRAIYDNLPQLPLDDPRYLDEFVSVAMGVFLADAPVIRTLALASAIGRSSGDWYQVDPESLLIAALTSMPASHRPVSANPQTAARVMITQFRGALYGWAAGFLSDEQFEQEVRRAGSLTLL